MIRTGAIAAALLLAAAALQPKNAAAENIELKFGLMTELSGASAPVGIDCQNGFEAARLEFVPDNKTGPYRLGFLYEDTKGSPAVGVSAFRKLVEADNVSAVLLKRSAIGMPVNPLSKQAKVPILGLVGPRAFTVDNPYAFRFYPTTAVLGSALASIARDLGSKQIAVISTEDEWQLAIREAFLQSLAKAPVFNQSVPAEETQFSGLIPRIKQLKPDAVFVNLAPGQTGLFVKRLREQGVSAQLLGNFYIREPAEIEKAGVEAVEGAYFTDITLDAAPRFQESFHKLLPNAPLTTTTYTCYTGLALVLQALKDEHGITDRESLYETLLKVRLLKLADGELPVRDREIVYPLDTFVLKAGKPVRAELK